MMNFYLVLHMTYHTGCTKLYRPLTTILIMRLPALGPLLASPSPKYLVSIHRVAPLRLTLLALPSDPLLMRRLNRASFSDEHRISEMPNQDLGRQ